MKGSPSDEMILSYNDVVLRRYDLTILNGPFYLNDRVIELYFSYLPSCYPSQDTLLVPPSIAFWIMKCPVAEALKDFIEPLHLSDKELVIFPVNDNEDVGKAEGGSHWSLLAYYRRANKFVHHDSCRGMNSAPAKQLYRAVGGYMGQCGSASEPSFLEWTDSPQQENGYDCGLYVMAIARVICNWHVNCKNIDLTELWFPGVKEQVTPIAVAEMRGEILTLVKKLMATNQNS
ncbi:NEDD8-specific protease 1 [Arachis stenosperma]|uniref:NEDD8-specific protease 1 n=1 Tax=Arachis stenosperma TaxID=217475 RepID=UPI0025AC7CAC|nr:NEDD8-specific protease 1 [Arachis stenosperma]